MLGLATPSAGKRAKEAAAAGAGGSDGNAAGAGGRGAKDETPNDVFRRWCGRLSRAVGKCFTARA